MVKGGWNKGFKKSDKSTWGPFTLKKFARYIRELRAIENKNPKTERAQKIKKLTMDVYNHRIEEIKNKFDADIIQKKLDAIKKRKAYTKKGKKINKAEEDEAIDGLLKLSNS